MTDIVDAHHHIWRQADMPWLMGPMQPRIFGPYGPIRRDYLIDEFLEDLSATGVVKSVYVQANWPKENFEQEVAWVQQVADDSGWPHGIVGYADVTADDVRPQLDRLTKYGKQFWVTEFANWHSQNDGAQIASYMHRRDKDLPPQIGVLVEFEGDDLNAARGAAMHVASMRPQFLTRDDVPAETIDNERRVAEEIARQVRQRFPVGPLCEALLNALGNRASLVGQLPVAREIVE